MKKIISFILLTSLILLCGCSRLRLPRKMPTDFYFTVSWGFDGHYDSRTKILSKGYNYDLEQECATELVLSEEDLEEIYKIIRRVRIDKEFKEYNPKFFHSSPSPALGLNVFYENQVYSVIVEGAGLNDSMFFYKEGRRIARAIRKIVQNYIINTEEYKSLPENQLFYD